MDYLDIKSPLPEYKQYSMNYLDIEVPDADERK